MVLAGAAHVTVVVSDATRVEPRATFSQRCSAACPVSAGLSRSRPGRTVRLTSTSSRSRRSATSSTTTVMQRRISSRTTTRGTPVRLHRSVVDPDLVIATGCIRGTTSRDSVPASKRSFPASARPPRFARTTSSRPQPVREPESSTRTRVESISKKHSACSRRRPICSTASVVPDGLVHARSPVIRSPRSVEARSSRVRGSRFASDALSITASLYQAAKIASACAPLVADGGALVLIAECADGVEPLATVNEAIFRIGVLPRLPSVARFI